MDPFLFHKDELLNVGLQEHVGDDIQFGIRIYLGKNSLFFLIKGKVLQSANDYIKGNIFWLTSFPNTWLFINIIPRKMLFFRVINRATCLFSGEGANQKLLLYEKKSCIKN